MSTSKYANQPFDAVCAVIVNWNSSDDTTAVVEHLHDLYPTLSIIVVDNNSTDVEWAKLLKVDQHSIRVSRQQTNGGYGAGVNEGLRIARSSGFQWAWLINPDSQPVAGCLEQLLANSDGAVMLSPRQVSGTAYETGDVYPSAATITGGRVSAITCTSSNEHVHDADVVTGTGLLVDICAAFAVGLFDEKYFHYKEEFDLAQRIAGIGDVRLVCCAGMWHRRGGSLSHTSPTAAYYRRRNEVLYLRKQLPQPRSFLRITAQGVKALSSLKGDYRVGASELVGFLDGVAGIGGSREEKRRIF